MTEQEEEVLAAVYAARDPEYLDALYARMQPLDRAAAEAIRQRVYAENLSLLRSRRGRISPG